MSIYIHCSYTSISVKHKSYDCQHPGDHPALPGCRLHYCFQSGPARALARITIKANDHPYQLAPKPPRPLSNIWPDCLTRELVWPSRWRFWRRHLTSLQPTWWLRSSNARSAAGALWEMARIRAARHMQACAFSWAAFAKFPALCLGGYLSNYARADECRLGPGGCLWEYLEFVMWGRGA